MDTLQTEFESTARAAERLGFTPTWIKRLASQGKIPGAYRLGERAWAIPATWNPGRQRRPKKLSTDTVDKSEIPDNR